MYRNITGSKYEATKGMGIVEIAKLVRKDLKESFPEYKCNVQVEKYSMGCSLHIQIHNTGLTPHSDEARQLEGEVRAVADEYNFDNSDPMTDYFSTRFYCNDVRVKS